MSSRLKAKRKNLAASVSPRNCDPALDTDSTTSLPKVANQITACFFLLLDET